MWEWVLIIFFWTNNGAAINVIDKFPTEISCEVAGQKVINTTNATAWRRVPKDYVCVKRGTK